MVGPWIGAAAAGAEEALRAFAGGAVGPAASLPLTLAAQTRSTGRVLDVVLLVVAVLVLVGGGFVIRRSRPGFRPMAFAGAALGALWLTVLNLEPFQIERVELTPSGVVEHRYNHEPTSLPWAKVRRVVWDDGRLWPLFSEDGALLLAGEDGVEVRIPAEAADRPAVAGAIEEHLPPEIAAQ